MAKKRTRTKAQGFGGPKKNGRPAFAVTPQNKRIVQLLAGAGIVRSEIAGAIGCSTRTLERHFKGELANAQTLLTAQAIGALVQAMRAGGRAAVAAAAFYLKCRCGWSEKGNGVAEDSADNSLHIHLPEGFQLPEEHPMQPFTVLPGGKAK